MNNTKILAFFNVKGRVGKTSLVYHLAWMYCELGFRVVVADLDPQAHLTTKLIDEDRLSELWSEKNHRKTVFGCVEPLIKGNGDIGEPHLEYIDDLALLNNNLAVLVGDLFLADFEDTLSQMWVKCMDGDERALSVISAFWRILQKTASLHQADVILVDLGPNLGSINRSALLAADYIVVPLFLDLFTLQSFRNLGSNLRSWSENWQNILARTTVNSASLPQGYMQAIGYVIWLPPIRLDRPVWIYNQLVNDIPNVYRDAVLNQPDDDNISLDNDPNCLAVLKHYHGLMSIAQEAGKPMFYLKPADGALGSYSKAAKNVYREFEKLASAIAQRTQVNKSLNHPQNLLN